MLKHEKIIFYTFLLLNILNAVSSNSNCTFARTCSECISVNKECQWCTQPNPKLKTEQRCRSKHESCSPIFQPQYTRKEIIENRPFSNDIDDPVQLRPQKIE